MNERKRGHLPLGEGEGESQPVLCLEWHSIRSVPFLLGYFRFSQDSFHERPINVPSMRIGYGNSVAAFHHGRMLSARIRAKPAQFAESLNHRAPTNGLRHIEALCRDSCLYRPERGVSGYSEVLPQSNLAMLLRGLHDIPPGFFPRPIPLGIAECVQRTGHFPSIHTLRASSRRKYSQLAYSP